MRIHAFRRTAPIEVDLNTRLIRFYLLENKAVVADVDEKVDADRLLAIPEAYREYVEAPIAANAGTPTDAQRQAAAAELLRQQQLQTANAVASGIAATDIVKGDSDTVLIGSDLQPAVIDLTGSKTIALGAVVARAFQAAKDEEGNALDIPGWNALEQADRDARIADAVTELENEAESEEEDEAQRLRDQIAADAKQAKAEKDAAAAAEAPDAPAAPTAEELAAQAAAVKFTLKNGDTVIDLKAMSDPELRTFAKSYKVVLPTGIRGDQIRQHIVDALAPEEA